MNGQPVCAIVLAAGLSRRMGRFKLLLPWQAGTVIGAVVSALEEAALEDILVVTGHRAPEVASALAASTARLVSNPRYADGEMLSSIQAGLAALDERTAAALLCLGDQPQIEARTVEAVLAAGMAGNWQPVVIPSYQMHAGHPLLLPRWLWPAIGHAQTDLRTVLAAHRDRIQYLAVETPTVLADLDTPDDYARWRG